MRIAPDVSIIIVNWNRLDDILKALRYLRYQGSARFEVVVVDNGSTDGSAERLAREDGIRFISLPSNVGPCTARNAGISIALGRYIFFLDSDAILSKRKLTRVVERMDQDPTIGILACRIVNGRTRRVDHWIHTQPSSDFQHHEFETYSFSAAGAVVSARALRDAGPFWDRLFIYNEEVDLSIRILRAGYRVVYYPKVRVYHCPSALGRTGQGEYLRFQVRNWIWISYRYYPAVLRPVKVAFHILIYLIKAGYAWRLRECVKGIAEGLWRTEIIDQFPDKLSWAEVRRIGALNVRTKIRFGR